MNQNPQEIHLYKKVKKLWDDGQSFQEQFKNLLGYYHGNYTHPNFKDQKKTSVNIIKEIIEAQLSAILDSQFTINVVPKVNVFADIDTIKTHAAIADIYNSELHNILKDNNWDDIKERVVRWGLVKFGALQTTFETNDDPQGKIKLTVIDPRNIKIDKAAKCFDDLTYIAYKIELNPALAKKRYAINPDGSVNEELAKKIDMLVEQKSEEKDKTQGGVVSVQSDQSTQLAYSYSSSGLQNGKILNIIVMFLLDDSLYLPETNDNPETQNEKQEYRMKYPYGRMVVFPETDKNTIILEDRPLPKGFCSLGNIDFFSSVDFDDIMGYGEIEDLTGVQDRINGATTKQRGLIAGHVASIIGDKDLVGDNDFVNQYYIPVENYANNPNSINTFTNNGITHAMEMQTYIDSLKNSAREQARVNETMINGVRQSGTTSAEQVEALQESPMASIRTKQRNFKDFCIKVGNKIINWIQETYTTGRLIELATCLTLEEGEAKYARMMPEQDQEGNEIIGFELYNEAGEAIKHIQAEKEWGYAVEVAAGTEIPRSRRENAHFMDSLAQRGVLGDMSDPDVIEQYLKAMDVPNYRAFIKLMKQKQARMAQNPIDVKVLISNPQLIASYAKLFEALQGYGEAKGQILTLVGLSPKVDTIETAPVQETTAKGDVKDVAAIDADKVSENPVKAVRGQNIAANIAMAEGRR